MDFICGFFVSNSRGIWYLKEIKAMCKNKSPTGKKKTPAKVLYKLLTATR